MTVPCEGCTLTQGYWKTHSKEGPAPYDAAWELVDEGDLDEDTIFYGSGQTWYEVLWTPPKRGNVYYILAHQFIAAKLNILNGAATTPEVNTTLALAEDFFETYGPDDRSLKGAVLRSTAISYSNVLDDYNNGDIGPGHCSE